MIIIVFWGLAALLPMAMAYYALMDLRASVQELGRLKQDLYLAHLVGKPGTWIMDPEEDYYEVKRKYNSLVNKASRPFDKQKMLMKYAKLWLLRSNMERSEFYDLDGNYRSLLRSQLGQSERLVFCNGYDKGQTIEDVLITFGEVVDYRLTSQNMMVVYYRLLGKTRSMIKDSEDPHPDYESEPFELCRWQAFSVYARVGKHWVLMNNLESEKSLLNKDHYQEELKDLVSTGLTQGDLVTDKDSKSAEMDIYDEIDDAEDEISDFIDNVKYNRSFSEKLAYSAMAEYASSYFFTVILPFCVAVVVCLPAQGAAIATIIAFIAAAALMILKSYYYGHEIKLLLNF